MTVALTPTANTEVLQDLLSRVPPNRRYSVSVVSLAVPFDILGVEFALTVSEPGVAVTIVMDRPSGESALLDPGSSNEVVVLPREEVTMVRLPLPPGISTVTVTSALGGVDFQIAVEDYVGWIAAFGDLLYEGTIIRLQDREAAIHSPTGSLLIERWFPESELLPRSNGLHRLGMRMITDGMGRARSAMDVQQGAGSQRGVERVAAALTGNNPVFMRPRNNTLVDFVEPLYGQDEDFSGVAIHLWYYDLCLNAFLVAGRYVENFPHLWLPVRYGESSLAYTEVESGRSHVLVNNAGAVACSVEDVLTRQGCFDRFRPFLRINITYSFVVCMAAYGWDTGVEVCSALGAVYFDCDMSLEELMLDPDMVSEEDPTGDGWVGHALDGRFDYPFGGGFDTFGAVEEFLADQCAYQRGPVVTPLSTMRTDITIDHVLEAFGSMTDLGPDGGDILTPV